MPETLRTDRYDLVLSGTLAARPAANTLPDKALYVCTDVGEVAGRKVFAKSGRGQDWVQMMGDHTHLFSHLEGFLSRGEIPVVAPPWAKIPSGSQTLWKHKVTEDLAIAGTTVQATRWRVDVGTAPNGGSITFVLKVNAAEVSSVTLPSGSTGQSATITPAKVIVGGDVLEIVGPGLTYGALGLDAKVSWERVKST